MAGYLQELQALTSKEKIIINQAVYQSQVFDDINVFSFEEYMKNDKKMHEDATNGEFSDGEG